MPAGSPVATEIVSPLIVICDGYVPLASAIDCRVPCISR